MKTWDRALNVAANQDISKEIAGVKSEMTTLKTAMTQAIERAVDAASNKIKDEVK